MTVNCVCPFTQALPPETQHAPDNREGWIIRRSQTPKFRLSKLLGTCSSGTTSQLTAQASEACHGPFLLFWLFIILLLLGVRHSFLSCSGELPVVNSSVGSNCCTCNCQSTLQAILQELKAMRKLMQIQAGTEIRPRMEASGFECIRDSQDVHGALITLCFPPCYLFFFLVFLKNIFTGVYWMPCFFN